MCEPAYSEKCPSRGGVAGPPGPALAGPLFSGLLPDCRDNLRTRRLVQVSTQTRLCPAYMRFSYNRSFACTYVMLNTYAYSNMQHSAACLQ